MNFLKSKATKASRTGQHGGKTTPYVGGTAKRRSYRLLQPVGSIVDSNGRRRSSRPSSSPNQNKPNPNSKVNNAIRFMMPGQRQYGEPNTMYQVKHCRTVSVVSSKKKGADHSSSVSSNRSN
mmetsp:Transcript_19337/g.19679  ORF Transcript_19337/g.19679 Transcript_19337/m.19679 type:complete len:122 (+) Transcript_19337:60-425(+)